jgi:hypothetical protein
MIITSAVASVASAQYSANSAEPRANVRSQGIAPTNDADAQSARIIQDLAETDRRVRAHEAAHLAASGGLAQGGANFSTVRGPDGRMYAVGGEVSIDVSPGRTPEETITRAETIRRAALAPADPSTQDYRVAAQAAQMQAEAQRELARQTVQGVPADGASPALSRSLASYNSTAQSEPQINLFA